jgi:hypothetical protein
MDLRAIFTLTACGILLAGCQAPEKSQSARRYIDFFEIGRVSPATDPQTETLKTRFRVLERPEAQADLGLSQEQIASVLKAYQAPSDQIPGLKEFIAQRRAAKQRTDLTEEERKAQNLESSRQIGKITTEFHTQELQRILTSPQKDRLNQIVLQVRGPVLLVVDAESASALGIDTGQMEQMREVVRTTDQEMIPTLQKFGRGFISGYSQNETEQDRTREMNELIPQLEQMMRRRDDRILQILTAQQRERFKMRQGKPLSIPWDSGDFLREPFEKRDS